MNQHISKTVSMTVGGVPRKHHFDANAYGAFEEATGEFFMDFYANIIEAQVSSAVDYGQELKRRELPMDPQQQKHLTGAPMDSLKEAQASSSLRAVRKLSMKLLSAMTWATMIEYRNDEPVWPMTLSEVRRSIELKDFGEIVRGLSQGFSMNAPEAQKGETSEVQPPPNPTVEAEPTAPSGGDGSGPSPEELLASLSPRLVA